ncbi:hypothetical protein HDZ31DRAFT_421, partial [Schizophyllum fasciatum]
PAPPSAYGENIAPDGSTSVQPLPRAPEPDPLRRKPWDTQVVTHTGLMPADPVNGFGIPQTAMRTLELMESVSTLEELMVASVKEGWGPKESLANFAHDLQKKGMKLKPNRWPLHDEAGCSLFLDPLPQYSSTPGVTNAVPPPPPGSGQVPPVPGSANNTPAMANTTAPTLFT